MWGHQDPCKIAEDEFVKINGDEGVLTLNSRRKANILLNKFDSVCLVKEDFVARKSLMEILLEYIHLTAGRGYGPILDNYSPSILIQLSIEQYQEIMTKKFTFERAVSHTALAVAKYVAVHKISVDINQMHEGFCILVRASKKVLSSEMPEEY